jgi:hypothetical protein
MIPNCKGCEEEFRQALFAQNLEGYYFATSLEREYIGRKHFMIYMVDDDGNIKYE